MRYIALVSLLLVLSPAAVRADDTATAKRLFLEGKSHYGNRSYVEALAAFKAALEMVKRSSVIIMVARSYRNLDRPDRALAHYKMYQLAWKEENPTASSPHRAEVKNQVTRLQTIVDLVRRGEALQETQPAAALALYQTALGMNPWPRIYGGMARCQLGLGKPASAQSPLKAALGYWERYRVTWTSRHPDEDPPDHVHVQRRIAELKKLERAIQARLARGPAIPPSAASEPAERGPVAGPSKPAPGEGRDASRPGKLWLALGITAAALTVSAEVTAWVAYGKATDYHDNEPEYGTYRNLTIAGHVVAGTMAAASAVSFYLYFRGGKDRTPGKASVFFMPGPTGWAVAGRVNF